MTSRSLPLATGGIERAVRIRADLAGVREGHAARPREEPGESGLPGR